jgi:hypothetical protein
MRGFLVAVVVFALACFVAGAGAGVAFAENAKAENAKKEKAKDRDARARAEIRQVLEQYLAARFRGAPWKDYRDLVTWSREQEETWSEDQSREQDEEQGPACGVSSTVVRSYEVGDIRLKDSSNGGSAKEAKRTALADVVFYQLGEYCAAGHEFKPAPRLDNAIFQLRKRSIVWAVEKTNRPGGQVDWHVVRERLQQALAEPAISADALSAEERERASASLATLERVANAIGRRGRGGGETRRAPESAAPTQPK